MEDKPEKEKNMPVVSLAELLESGVHFGHQTRRWNPKMSQYIYTARNGVHIIDLVQTAQLIEEAYEFVEEKPIAVNAFYSSDEAASSRNH